ncbi:MAG: YIP1 family protein [Chitinophagaceae bacterium]|nr:YIP1 family protein [Chitinophagaceae bacterium]
MNLIERVKNILLTPKTEWDVINGETATPMSLLTGYVLLLALIPAGCSFLGAMLFTGGLGWGMKYYITLAIISYILSVASFFVFTYALDLLATSFGSEKNINKSAQVAAYSSTASYVAGILSIIPFLGILVSLAGAVYAAYLMYLGVGPLKKTPEDKKVIYVVVVILAVFVAYAIISAILGAVLLASFRTSVLGY